MSADPIRDFKDQLFDTIPDLSVDAEDIGMDIDLENIGSESSRDAIELIENLSKFYYDDQFMQAHPTFKRRVDTDLESLRLLFKMRKSDEVVQDALIQAIAKNTKNASLYKALSDMQKTIISITSKIGEIITGLNTMMKGYQLELNFDGDKHLENQEDIPDSPGSHTTRGSKEFIQQMRNEIEPH